MKKYIFVFLLYLCLFANIIIAAPAKIRFFNLYENSNLTDSSIYNVSVGKTFNIYADTSTPLYTGIADTIKIYVTHGKTLSNQSDTIEVILTQNTTDTFYYQSNVITIVEAGYTNSQQLKIGVSNNSGEYIVCLAKIGSNIYSDSLYMKPTQLPSTINNINFMSSSFSSILTDNIVLGSMLYITANGIDVSPNVIDSMPITVTNTYGENITIFLNETNYNSGEFRGTCQLNSFTDDYYDYVKAAKNNDTIVITENISGNTDVVTIKGSVSPVTILELSLKTNSSYNENITFPLKIDDYVYVKLVAYDSSSITTDTTLVKVTNTVTNEYIYLNLQETNSNSGDFRNSFYLSSSYTSEINNRIHVKYGDTILVTSVTDSTKQDTVDITIPHSPSGVISLNYKNEFYTENISSAVPSSKINISLIGTGANSKTADSIIVTVQNKFGESINLTLTETGENTEEYRGQVQLYNLTDQTSNIIKAYQIGDTLLLTNSISSNTDLLTITTSNSPTSINNIIISQNSNFTLPINNRISNENTLVYVKISATDINAATKDTTEIKITNIRNNEFIKVMLNETNNNSGEFTNNFYITNYITDDFNNKLKTKLGDTIYIESVTNSNKADTLYITTSFPPSSVSNLFFTNSDYLTDIGDSIVPYVKVYITAYGADANSLLRDTLPVTISNNYGENFTINLYETEKNNGKYTGFINLNNYTDNYNNIIKAYNYGDTIKISESISNKTDILNITNSLNPSTIYNLDVKNEYYTSSLGNTKVNLNSKVYVEIIAADKNSLTVDTTSAIIKNTNNSDSILVTLQETSNNSGIFRNYFNLYSNTNQNLNQIYANYGNIITVTSFVDNTKIDTFYLTSPIPPTIIYDLSFKNSAYDEIIIGDIAPYSTLYIESVGKDNNSLTIDTITATLNNSYSQNITITLTETNSSSGIFKGTADINNYTSQNDKYIKCYVPGDTVKVTVPNYSDSYVVRLDYSNMPDTFYSINDKTSDWLQIKSNEYNYRDNVYIEINARDTSPYTIDTASIEVYNINNQDSIILILTQTNKTSNFFRGILKLDSYSSYINKYIRTNYGDTIVLYILDNNNHRTNFVDTLTVTIPRAPNYLNQLYFTDKLYGYNDKNYVSLTDELYISAYGQDNNSLTIDTFNIILQNNYNETISLELTENSKNSGIYSGKAHINSFTSDIFDYLKLINDGDTVLLYSSSFSNTDIIELKLNQTPDTVYSILYYDENYYQPLNRDLIKNETLKLKVTAEDKNITTVDTIAAIVLNAGAIIYSDTFSGNVNLTVNNKLSVYVDGIGETYTFQASDFNNGLANASLTEIATAINKNSNSMVVALIKNNQLLLAAKNNIYIDTSISNSCHSELKFNNATTVTSNKTKNSIEVILTQTSANNNEFRNECVLSNSTIQSLNTIGADYGDTIIIYVKNHKEINDFKYIYSPALPDNVTGLDFYNFDYSNKISFSAPDLEVGIQLLATDKSQYYIDSVPVSLYSGNGNETITIYLYETAQNSGIFRNTFFLKNYSFETLKYINAYNTNDTVVMSYLTTSAQLSIKSLIIPDTVIAVNFYNTQSYNTIRTAELGFDENGYIEVTANDLNPYTEDYIDVKVESYNKNTSNTQYIIVRLTETDINSSKYRGAFKITYLTNDTIDELQSNYGDTIRVTAPYNSSIAISKELRMSVPQKPTTYNQLIFTKSGYTEEWPASEQINLGDNLYVRFTGTDANPLTVDTVQVVLTSINSVTQPPPQNLNDYYIYILSLTETEKHSGVFVGSVLLDTVKAPSVNRMATNLNDYIIAEPYDTSAFYTNRPDSYFTIPSDTIQTATPQSPTAFVVIKLYESNFSAIKLSPVKWNENLYIEVEADKTTTSNLIVDTMAVQIKVHNSDETNTLFVLTETGIYSGIFRSEPIEVKKLDEVGQQKYFRRLEVTQGDYVEIIPSVDGVLDTSVTLIRHVANYITPTRIKTITPYRDSAFSNSFSTYISYEENYRNLYFQVEAFDIDGLSTDTLPYSNDKLPDTVELKLYSPATGSSASVTLVETGDNTNIFRNDLDVNILVQSLPVGFQISANRNDTIIVYANVSGETAPLILIVQQYKQPDEVRGIKFFTDGSYSRELSGINLLSEDYVYIQATGRNSASILVDTISVVLNDTPSIGPDTFITVILTETAVGSERYRVQNPEPVPQLYYFNDNINNLLKASTGDTITVETSDGKKDYTRVGSPQSPDIVYTIGIYKDASFASPYSSFIGLRDKVYLKAIGDIGNNVIADTTSVTIVNLNTNQTIHITLKETAANNGIYTGSFKLEPFSNDTLDELGADYADSISITSDAPIDTPNPRIMQIVSNLPPTTINSINFTLNDYSTLISTTSNRLVTENSNLYLVVNGEDANDNLADYITAKLISFSSCPPAGVEYESDTFYRYAKSSITINLNETGEHTGKYTNTAFIRDYGDTFQKYIAANGNDTILLIVNDDDESKIEGTIVGETLNLSVNNILDLIVDDKHYTFNFTNADFTNGLSKAYLTEIADTLNQQIYSNFATLTNSNMKMILKGKRNLTINNVANSIHSLLGISVLTAKTKFYTDTIYVSTVHNPTYITYLKFRNSDYTQKIQTATFGDMLNLELFGDIATTIYADTTQVNILKISAGDTLPSETIPVTLQETDLSSGLYRGQAQLVSSPSQVSRPVLTPPIININSGDTLIVRWSLDLNNNYDNDSITIVGQIVPTPPTKIYTVRFKKTDDYILDLNNEILPNSNIYIAIQAEDLNPYTIDTTVVMLTNIHSETNPAKIFDNNFINTNDTIFLVLTETTKNSGDFRNFAKLSSTTNQSQFELQANFTDHLIVSSLTAGNSDSDMATLTQYRKPSSLDNLYFMKDADYSNILYSPVSPNSYLYVEANGNDRNPLTADTFEIFVISNKDSSGITVTLTETTINSGKFRGKFKLNNYSNQTLSFINAYENNDILVIIDTGVTSSSSVTLSDTGYLYGNYLVVDTVAIFASAEPTNIYAVRLKNTTDYNEDRTTAVTGDENLFIEVTAEDINDIVADTTRVLVFPTSDSTIFYKILSNTLSDTDIINITNKIYVDLKETDLHSSIYRKEIKLTAFTNDTLDELNLNGSDTLIIISLTDKSKYYYLSGTKKKPPTAMNSLSFTDDNYIQPADKQLQVGFGDKVYIKFIGTDGNPLTPDTVAVLLTSTGGDKNKQGTGINQLKVTLTENSKNSGVFTGFATLSQTKNEISAYLNSTMNDFITLTAYDTSYYNSVGTDYLNMSSDTLQTATQKTPSKIFTIKLKKSDKYIENKLSPVLWSDNEVRRYMYIEVEGDKSTSSNLLADTVAVFIGSSSEDGNNSPLILEETEIHSGIFRGKIEVLNLSNVGQQHFAASLEVVKGDTILIYPVTPFDTSVKLLTYAADYVSPTRLKNITFYRDKDFSNAIPTLGEISYEDNYKYLYIEAEAWDFAGLSTDTIPYINDELKDTVKIIIKSEISNDSIEVLLEETGENTNIYRSTDEIPFLTKSVIAGSNNSFVAIRGETITIYGKVTIDSYPVSLFVANYKEPELRDIKFYKSKKYQVELNGTNINIEDYLYIQALGRNSNPLLQDTISVKIKTIPNPISYYSDTAITVTLTETAVGSEIYRVSGIESLPRIWYYTDDVNNFIFATVGDTVITVPNSSLNSGKDTDITQIVIPKSPDFTYSINIFSDPSYSVSYLGKTLPRESKLYIEVRGDVGNNSLEDTTSILMNANASIDTVTVELKEIFANAGVYRGIAYTGIQSSSTNKTLGVSYGDKVYFVSTAPTPAVSVSINVVQNANPSEVNSIRFMTSDYSSLLDDSTNGKLLEGTNIYLEANGLDASPSIADHTMDTFVVVYAVPYNKKNILIDDNLKSPSFYTADTFAPYVVGYLAIELQETDKNTGKFRNSATLSNVNDTFQRLLKASSGYTLISRIIINNQVYYDTAFVAVVEEPAYLTSLSFKENLIGSPDTLKDVDRKFTFGETLYIQAFGSIATNLLADSTKVIIYKINSGETTYSDSVFVYLNETDKTSGFYQGIAKISENSSQPSVQSTILPIINVNVGDTIVLKWWKNNILEDSIIVAVPVGIPPKDISSIKIYSDINYTNLITAKLDITQKMYIELTEKDTNPIYASNESVVDTIILKLTNSSDTINIVLTETGNNSKVYRGTAELSTITNETLDKLKVDYGYKIIFTPSISSLSITPNYFTADSLKEYSKDVVNFSEPKSITSINFMNNTYSSVVSDNYAPLVGDFVYIEINGEDANPQLQDEWNVLVSTYKPNGDLEGETFYLKVTESNKNTGQYRAKLQIDRLSFPALNKIRGAEGDTLIVSENITGINITNKLNIAMPSEPNDVVDLVFTKYNTDTGLGSEIDLGYIDIQASALDQTPNIQDKITIHLYSTNDSSPTGDSILITLKQPIDKLDGYLYKATVKLSEDTTNLENDIPIFHIIRGNYLNAKWFKPVYAPLTAKNRTAVSLITEYNPPDTVDIQIIYNGETLPSTSAFSRLAEGDSIYFIARELSQSHSNPLIKDTCGITIYKLNKSQQTISKTAGKHYASSYKNYSLTSIIIQLIETDINSKIYKSGKILITSEGIYDENSGNILLANLNDEFAFLPNNTTFNGPSLKVSLDYKDLSKKSFMIFPNPWKINSGFDYISFYGLLPESKYNIYNSIGQSVISGNIDNTGALLWYLKNSDNKKIASGIYIYVVYTKDGNKKIGKIAVIR